jgi:cytochrome bd-type quinol oxidase subunit 1
MRKKTTPVLKNDRVDIVVKIFTAMYMVLLIVMLVLSIGAIAYHDYQKYK